MRFYIFKILSVLILIPSLLVILIAGFALTHLEIELAIFCYVLGFVSIIIAYVLAKIAEV